MKLKHIDLIIYTGIACLFARRIWKRCHETSPARVCLDAHDPTDYSDPFNQFDSVDSAAFRRFVNDSAKRMAAEYRKQRRPLDYEPTCGSC